MTWQDAFFDPDGVAAMVSRGEPPHPAPLSDHPEAVVNAAILARTQKVTVRLVSHGARRHGIWLSVVADFDRTGGQRTGAVVEPTGLVLTTYQLLQELDYKPRPLRRDELPPRLLRLGVVYDDGRSATSLGTLLRAEKDPPLVLDVRGATTSTTEVAQEVWLSPAPPSTTRWVVEWPSEGIEEAWTTLPPGWHLGDAPAGV